MTRRLTALLLCCTLWLGAFAASVRSQLQDRLEYAQTVVKWWQDTPRKQAPLERLVTAIDETSQLLASESATDEEMQQALKTLNTRIAAVDKKIYCSTNACGTDQQLQDNSSHWSYERSLQSKHWILFWESGYGTAAPASVATILKTADRIFEFYADSLKFITINQGKSKTDTYKMIIRLRSTDEWEASGSGIDNQIGLLTLSRWAYTSRDGQTVAHEIGHCFQYQVHCDNGNNNGWMYNWGRSTLNVFWEMCAQWQAYKFYPQMQFGNEWFNASINGQHRHPLCAQYRYENFFIQDYFCQRHGMDIIARLWNESQSPEDPLQAYMRLTMRGTTQNKLAQLGDEMWEYGARMASFDMDHIRARGKASIGKRAQTKLSKDADGFWWPSKDNCIENWGNNVIRINNPGRATTIYAEFEGKVGAEGYVTYNKARAGWRIGFVALKRDGTRLYGDIERPSFKEPDKVIAFDCPAGCTYVWFVVSGAPSYYWTHDWLSWSEEGQTEQWPYRVRFFQTNVYGEKNVNDFPVGINDIAESQRRVTKTNADNSVYNLQGQRLGDAASLRTLSRGIYIVGGKKIIKTPL